MFRQGYAIRNQEGLYFLTFTIVKWIDVFSRQVYRDILLDSLAYCRKEKGLSLKAYVIMSNHIHIIARAENGNLSDVVRDFKSFTSKKILHEIEHGTESRKDWLLHMFAFKAKYNKRNEKYQLWVQENHPEGLESNAFIEQKLNYIHQNPVRAGLVEEPWHYKYSSAADYSGGKGLIEIDLIA